MVLWIDGIAFDNAKVLQQASKYATVEHTRRQSNMKALDKFFGTGIPMAVAVQIKGSESRRIIEQLNGIADRRGAIIIRSGLQKVWGDQDEVFMAVKGYQPTETGPFYYTGALQGEFQGTPRTSLGTYYVTSVHLESDFTALEGRTVIPLPPGSTNVSHTATAREGRYAIIEHADWDGGGYDAGATKRAKVQYTVDPVLFHADAVKVTVAGNRIMGKYFDEPGEDITIENGFCRIIIDMADQLIHYYFKESGAWVLKESFSIQAFTDFNIIINENDYVAGQFDTGEVLELWRGKDPVISNTVAGSFLYAVNAAPGADATTSGSTNYLQIETSGVYIACQRHFKITTGKSIEAQGGGDPSPAGDTTDLRFLITATADTIADRAREILKRQA